MEYFPGLDPDEASREHFAYLRGVYFFNETGDDENLIRVISFMPTTIDGEEVILPNPPIENFSENILAAVEILMTKKPEGNKNIYN